MAPGADEVRANPKLVRRAVLLAAVLAGLQTADPVVSSLALPLAGKSLNMTASTLALAASISTLCLAATVVLLGALADRVGRRKLMLLVTIGTIVGDVIVFLAPQSSIFMLGRAIAGISLGGVLATSYAYIRTVSPPERLGANLGLFGAVGAGLSLPMCLVAAGLASFNWRLAFLCIPVIAALCLPFLAKVFPAIPPSPVRRQLYGVSLAGLGVVGILFGISKTADKLIAPAADIPIVIGIVLIVIAGIIGLKSKRPAYPVRIFRSPVFITAAVAGALWNMAMAVGQLQTSNLWQYVDGAAPFTAALLQLPFTFAVVVGSLLIGRLLTKGRKPREIISLGFLVVAGGFVILSVTGQSAMGIVFNLGLVVVGFGAGAASVAQSQILITEAPGEFLGPVAASRTTFGQIGYAIGLSASTVVTMVLTMGGLEPSSARAQLNQFLTADIADIEGDPAVKAVVDTVAPAYTHGFQSGMLIWTGVFIIGAIVAFILMSLPKHPLVSEKAEARTPAPDNESSG